MDFVGGNANTYVDFTGVCMFVGANLPLAVYYWHDIEPSLDELANALSVLRLLVPIADDICALVNLATAV